MNELEETFGEVIHSYTRAQAIEDGELVDVSHTADRKGAGIRYAVALTRSVWNRHVEVPTGVTGQDMTGRLWDILWMFKLESRKPRPQPTDEILFKVHVRNANKEGTPPLITLKALCGPGDDGEPVITIMLPEED